MKLILIEPHPSDKTKCNIVLSPHTTKRNMYDSKGMIQYLTRNRIIPTKIYHTVHTDDVRSDGLV